MRTKTTQQHGRRTQSSHRTPPLLSFLLITTAALAAQPTAAQSVSGTVYRDYNANGVRDIREPGIAGVSVSATDAAGMVAGQTLTLDDGTYSISVSTPVGEPLRVAFSNTSAFLQPGVAGSQSFTNIAFVSSGDTNVDRGLSNPAQFCQTPTALGDLELATSCYITGEQSASTEEALVSFDYLAGDTGPASDVDLPAKTTVATAQEIGPTWGLAYQRSSQSLFAAAFMKRHVSFASDGGTGKLFIIDRTTNAVTEFLDLDTLFGPATAGTDPHPAGTDLSRDNNNDGANGPLDEAWDAVGKRAFGDIEISEDELTLYAVNLFDRSLYAIPLGSDATNPVAPTQAGDITITPIPSPCANPDDARPFALGVRDGQVYVGGVCSAESTQNSADLSAYVYTFSEAGGFGATPILDVAIDHPRGCAVVPGCAAADWNPWRPTFTVTATNFGGEFIQPQPMLTDIEFDNNDLILGFRDRFGDQSGFRELSTDPADTQLYIGDSAGSVLRACDVGGTLQLESNGSCGSLTGAGVGNGRGPGGGQFYVIDFPDHHQVALAGLAKGAGFADLAFSMYDPIFNSSEFFDGGNGWNSDTDGSTSRRYRIYSSNDTDPNTFAKGGGLGDTELMCRPAPIEVGNRVWDDLDNDGVQDADEPGLSGITVSLSCAGSPLATTTTDSDGQYLFNDSNVAGGIPTGTTCDISIDAADSALGGRMPVTADSGPDDSIDSDGILNAGIVSTSFTTGAAGSNNHSYDFGFTTRVIITGDIGDKVWCDGIQGSGNNVFDNGEGLNNITVDLFADSDCDTIADSGTPLATTTTAGDGDYLFTGLVVGTDVQPECYVSQVDGNDPDLAGCTILQSGSDTTGAQLSDTVPQDLTHDYYFVFPEGRLGDQVWCESATNFNTVYNPADGDLPLTNIQVSLMRGNNCATAPAPGTLIAQQDTDAQGQYQFGGLAVGAPGSNDVCYFVTVDTNDTDLGSCNNPLTATQFIPSLNATVPEDQNNDFGFNQTLSLGDRVWYDNDQDGIQDDGEAPVAGVTVNLHDDGACANAPVASTTTDGDGLYRFDNLNPGTYCVEFIPPAGWSFSPQDQGSDDREDSDSDPVNGRIQGINLNTTDLSFDAGLFAAIGNISGVLFCDSNPQNGVQDSGEEVAGVRFELFHDTTCDGTGDVFIDSQETAADGSYLFSQLPVALSPAPPNPQLCYTVQADLNDPDLLGCTAPIEGSTIEVPLDTDEPDSTGLITSVGFRITAIPTLNTVGLLLITILLLGLGLGSLRSRRE